MPKTEKPGAGRYKKMTIFLKTFGDHLQMLFLCSRIFAAGFWVPRPERPSAAEPQTIKRE
jgi:hypothetical protein